MLTENPGAIAKHTARLPRGVMRRFGDDVGRLVAGVAALPWSVVGWRGTARSGRGARRCEVELDAGGGDALLLAGQQGQRAGIGRGGAVQVQGAWPQPGVADGCDLGRVHQRLTGQLGLRRT